MSEETDKGNVRSADKEKPRTWTPEEMEEAEPYPMPEVDDDDTGGDKEQGE